MFIIIKISWNLLMNTCDFRYFGTFLRIGPFRVCEGDLAPVHIRPLNHLYEGEGSKARRIETRRG